MIRRIVHLALATGLAALVKIMLGYVDIPNLDMFFAEYLSLLLFSFSFHLLGDGGFYRGFSVLVLTVVTGLFSASFLASLSEGKLFFSFAGILYAYSLIECIVYKAYKGYRLFIHGYFYGNRESEEV